MKEKIKKVFSSKIIVIILALVIGVGFGFVVYLNSENTISKDLDTDIVKKDENLENNNNADADNNSVNKNNITNDNNDSTNNNVIKNDVKEFLYKINYFDYDGKVYLYEADIDIDYNLYVVNLKNISSSNLLKVNEAGKFIVVKSKDYENFQNKKREKIELTKKEKDWLKKILNSFEYDEKITDETILKYGTFYIKNQNNDAVSLDNFSNYAELKRLLLVMEEKDIKYIKPLLDNTNVKKLILDNEYTELNINSKLVRNLYNNVYLGDYITDHYEKGKLTNDYIITTVLRYIDVNNMANLLEHDFLFSNYSVDIDKFDFVAKKLFGENIKYNIEDYKGSNISYPWYEYDWENNRLSIFYPNGSEFVKQVFGEIAYAYEKNNKLVIIERTIYGERGNYYDNCQDKNEIVNSNEHIYDWNFIDGFNENAFFTDYTYYAYIFEKTDDNNYYVTDFKRLN